MAAALKAGTRGVVAILGLILLAGLTLGILKACQGDTPLVEGMAPDTKRLVDSLEATNAAHRARVQAVTSANFQLAREADSLRTEARAAKTRANRYAARADSTVLTLSEARTTQDSLDTMTAAYGQRTAEVAELRVSLAELERADSASKARADSIWGAFGAVAERARVAEEEGIPRLRRDLKRAVRAGSRARWIGRLEGAIVGGVTGYVAGRVDG